MSFLFCSIKHCSHLYQYLIPGVLITILSTDMVLCLDSSSSSPPEAPGVAGHFLPDVVIVSETLETDCYVSTFLQLLSVVCSTTHCLLTVMSVILGNYIICHIFTKDIGWG